MMDPKTHIDRKEKQKQKRKTNEFDDKDDDKVNIKKKKRINSNFMTQMEQSYILHTNPVNIRVDIQVT